MRMDVTLGIYSVVPGPGFYNWSKIFERKAQDASKEKGKIQYKFIYGHPSWFSVGFEW